MIETIIVQWSSQFFTYLHFKIPTNCYFQFAGHSALYGMNRSLKSGGIFPSTFNVAAKADIFVNATCGEEGPETFCKPSESSRCGVCDARSPDPGKRHNISNILDSSPGKWWQSPTLARGDRYEYVTIVLDLKQVRRTRKEASASRISPFFPLLFERNPFVRGGGWRQWSPAPPWENRVLFKEAGDIYPTIYPPSPPLSFSLLNSSGLSRCSATLKGRLVVLCAGNKSLLSVLPFRKNRKVAFPLPLPSLALVSRIVPSDSSLYLRIYALARNGMEEGGKEMDG